MPWIRPSQANVQIGRNGPSGLRLVEIERGVQALRSQDLDLDPQTDEELENELFWWSCPYGKAVVNYYREETAKNELPTIPRTHRGRR